MAYIGDINKDSYADFAIGAPYENEQEGLCAEPWFEIRIHTTSVFLKLYYWSLILAVLHFLRSKVLTISHSAGAVYIYHGSINGIKKMPAQAIRPTGLGSLGGKILKLVYNKSQ